jgi:hypothetical protein
LGNLIPSMKTKFLTTAFLSLAVAGVVVAAATLPKTPSLHAGNQVAQAGAARK